MLAASTPLGSMPEMPQWNSAERQAEHIISSALLLDLEVSHQGRILEIAALAAGETYTQRCSELDDPAFDQLTTLAARANCVLGHNLIAHDLRILNEKYPGNPLRTLPVIDTLLLSPIAFPQNPYHRLIKDYKLVRESMNDPLADARQAAVVFKDELLALAGLRLNDPAVFDLLHFLLTKPDEEGDVLARGMEIVFGSLGGKPPTEATALQYCAEIFRKHGCRHVEPASLMLRTMPSRLAVAYAVAWLRVAGANSVIPAWVRHQHPETVKLIERLRDIPCADPQCSYCRRVHDAREQLKAFFGFDDFRATPCNATGGSLQRDIVESGLRNESLLAILPTGGGKSLCFQLPALVRNYRRGVLTVVISPLQALMKDQVDGLVRRTGTAFAAALYGLLTQPERGDVLERVRLGDVAILYISPEQLRNRSFRKAIASREIGCWIFDEAHCLSKWGHDFRPDYLYAGRFIREFAKEHGMAIPPICCFTATAKTEVKAEIIDYFKRETGRVLTVFEGGVERQNLRFAVQYVSEHEKLERVHGLLSDYLGTSGSAIVFHATRNATELSAQFLQSKGWKAARFHAGMSAPQKKQLQDQFLAGEVKIICATNAFGMGIDKEDVRLVVHADTPGSLENYLQEAGRAGRDGRPSDCILLYDEADCEKQFRMSAGAELTHRDIAAVLRSLRKAARGGDTAIVTSGEILRDESFEGDIDLRERSADTKVRTAVAWLERAHFIERDENVTSVFQARLLVKTVEEADAKMQPLNLSERERGLWSAIIRALMNAEPTDPLSVDSLALLPEFVHYAQLSPAPARPEEVSAKVLKVLGSMTNAGLLKRDTLLTAFVRHKVSDHSRLRLQRILTLDRKLLDLMSSEAPDAEGWMALSLRTVNQRLIDDGNESSIEALRNLLKSLSQDGRGFGGTQGSIELRYSSRDHYRVKLARSWSLIRELAERRNRVASVLLNEIESRIPDGSPAKAELLVEFTFEQLSEAIKHDLELRHEVKDINSAVERGLMFLHEQQVIVLQQGLAIFRSAMTIRLNPDAKGKPYKSSDYRPLQDHYKERTLQVHVMNKFGQLGLRRISEAVDLARRYFTDGKLDFLKRFFRDEADLIYQATTAASYQKIVTDLGNPSQISIVTAPASKNLLVLAGPGSGKTTTVVHRCAYLLRVERVRPQSILVCCFNRQAAVDLRRRLHDLVGSDAHGVTVLTYHGLALRLLGRSLQSSKAVRDQEINFDALIEDAVRLLRGDHVPLGIEADEIRERLLTGFQYLLVDEYQDIDEPQYEMISAIAGRAVPDSEARLSIMAVGDDDQNIYSFRGTNVEFIRRFERDYGAEPHYLIENYRSTRYIIDAANHLISANRDRMKTGKPVRIDSGRSLLPAGGDMQARDPISRGKVVVTRVSDGAAQAAAVAEELTRLSNLGVDLSRICVLSSTREDLAHVRCAAEQNQVPVRWYASRQSIPALHRVREIRRFLLRLNGGQSRYASASDLMAIANSISTDRDNPWSSLLHELLESWKIESNDSVTPIKDAAEFLYESLADRRRDFSFGKGVMLSTVHSAKGTEHDHVLVIGRWRRNPSPGRLEEQRRLLYVAMTRARKTLSLLERADDEPSLIAALEGSAIHRTEFARKALPVMPYSYTSVAMDELDIGYAGRFYPTHAIHAAIASLCPGANLRMSHSPGAAVDLLNEQGVCVGRLSRIGSEAWLPKLESICDIRVQALIHREAAQDPDDERRQLYRSAEWEIPLIEIRHRE